MTAPKRLLFGRVLALYIAYCVVRDIRNAILRNGHYIKHSPGRAYCITFVLWLAGLSMVLAGCWPTGPTPVEYVVPTAVRQTPTPMEPTPVSPTIPPPSPELPTSTPVESVSGAPTSSRTDVVTQDGWSTSPLVPGGRVLTPTAGRDSVLWIAQAGPGLGLYLHNLRSDKTQLLAEPSSPGGCICRGYRRGDWVVMVETEPGATWWEVSALNLITGERSAVGRTDDPATRAALRPGEFAVNADGQVVWKDVTTEANGSVVQMLRLHDVATGQVSEIVTVRSPVRIEQVAMYGDWVVWNEVTEGEAGTRGDVYAYNVRSDEIFPIGETGRAWKPAVWGTTVVWKHADGLFADGDVFLLDLETGDSRLLTQDGQVSEVGVGDRFVVWASASAGVLVRYDLEGDTEEVVGRGSVGWLAAGGSTIAWLLNGDPYTLHIAWRQ